MQLEGHTDSITSGAFSQDGQVLASGSADGCVLLWDLEVGRLFQRLCEHGEGISSIAFNFDGAVLASGCYDTSIKIWSVKTNSMQLLRLSHR